MAFVARPETREGAIRSLLLEVRRRLDKGLPIGLPATRCMMELAVLGVPPQEAIERAKALK